MWWFALRRKGGNSRVDQAEAPPCGVLWAGVQVKDGSSACTESLAIRPKNPSKGAEEILSFTHRFSGCAQAEEVAGGGFTDQDIDPVGAGIQWGEQEDGSLRGDLGLKGGHAVGKISD